MKKQLLLFLTIMLSFNSYSQISFEKGYYIDNNNKKINCLIKNIDWMNNPTEFEYKQSENDNSKRITIKSVKEFGVYNFSKYIRINVNIDRSSNNYNNLSEDRRPLFKEEELFMRVLVESKSSLYEYVDNNIKRFFFKKENFSIKQLIFKKYRTSDGKVGENNRFRQQLLNNFKCSDIKIIEIEKINYKKIDLVKFFNEYNKCNQSKIIVFDSNKKKDLFNLSIRPRINNSSLILKNGNKTTNNSNINFDTKLGFGIGLETEFILPFNKNKWAIIVEPTYQIFKSEKTNIASRSFSVGEFIIRQQNFNLTTEIDYSTIEIPVGLRHYFYLNKKSKLFLNTSFLINLDLKGEIIFKEEGVENKSDLYNINVKSQTNIALGFGYKHNKKLRLELRYNTKEILEDNGLRWSSDFNTLSIIFGYSIF